ncbi:hypothetical protein CHLRE_10g457228v5 [Chlamydomonas reinhardtii]|uniref:Uncharacterized protein n=1 Tax=Chlamydomonas reinhardtii TaxID=3055 RepID=A0A2K3DBL9_CHLRE|nr:uncharacterized protein CHLRE_10g457228v5 [Chlamydomonas reinhardtii]XP_042920481.1 uncharacterized protein CHLRE_10g457228v5 [Chlamydomonas reinhardtii]PNW77924.1 hypothetical protein CHLRE_10g457228v5 [Chlamydomonas reinhardtii]PNW77925.1 hypothetical protein CHLRE_10g457228v5 [Chlamydomonas reinhardtii]
MRSGHRVACAGGTNSRQRSLELQSRNFLAGQCPPAFSTAGNVCASIRFIQSRTNCGVMTF